MEKYAKLYFNDFIYIFKCDNSFMRHTLLSEYPEVREVMMQYSNFLLDNIINKDNNYEDNLENWKEIINATLQKNGLNEFLTVRKIRDYHDN